MSSTSGHVCAVKNCFSRRSRTKESFFRFPKDAQRARVWAVACGREDLLDKLNQLHTGYRICGMHFETRMFLNDLRNRLQPNATPTVFPSLEGSSQHSFDHTYSVFRPHFSSDHTEKVCDNEANKPPCSMQEVQLIEDGKKSWSRTEFEGTEKKVNVIQDIVVVPAKKRLLDFTDDEPELHKVCKTEAFMSSISPIIIEEYGSRELGRKELSTELDVNVSETSHESLLSPTSTQTPKRLSARTPRKENLRQSLKKLRNENYYLKNKITDLQKQRSTKSDILDEISLEDYKKLTYKFCPSKEVADFINVQVSELTKHPKGRRYSDEFKNTCLAMYFTSPKLYKTKLVNTFSLPSARLLLRHIQYIKIKPGYNSGVFRMLKMKVENFNDKNKLCVLCLDEISIKANLFYNCGTDEVVGLEDFGEGEKSLKPAQNATVLMVKGIYTNWKQPLCYYFHNSTCPAAKLQEILIKTIKELTTCGLRVCVVISDMGSNNLQLARLLGVKEEMPYFFIEDQKIIYMFDTPHLLKATRNNLLKYIFVYDDKKTSWEHIKTFYQNDKQYQTRAAPKLTDSHIQPNNFEKMKVKYAAQVLSATVSASMNLYIRFGVLPAEAAATSELVQTLDNLFDLLNSSATSKCKKHNRAFKALDYQIDLVKQCDNIFKGLKVITKENVDITNKMKFIKGWRITMNGLLCLWEILSDNGFDYVFTRRLNQDPLENFFGSIRLQSGNCVNPTPIQFQRAFKKLLCLNLLNSGTENCEGDTDKVLLKISDFPKETFISKEKITEPNIDKMPVIDTDYRSSNLLEQNFTRYVCGYLINKCLKIHTCDICLQYSKSYNELDDSSLFCYFKAYENGSLDTFGNLKMPDNDFVYLIASLEVSFQETFENVIKQTDIISKFISLYDKFIYIHPCINFPYMYLLKLYSRLRLFYSLKTINRNFKSTNKTKLIIWKHQ